MDRLKLDPPGSIAEPVTDQLKLDNYQLLPGSALAVDSTATDGSALTPTVTPLGSTVSTSLDPSVGSALATPVSVDANPSGPVIDGSALAEVNSDSSTSGSASTLTDSKVNVATDSQTDMAAPKRIPGVTEPYKHVGTRERLEVALVEFMLRPNLPGLSWLHLCAGVYCSDLAKKRGIFHGLCDEHGIQAGLGAATHVGFTAGDEEEMEN